MPHLSHLHTFPHTTGGDWHYFSVPAGETKVFDVARSFFAYTLTACAGDKVASGHIDLANGGELRVPKLCEFYWIDYAEALVVDGVLTEADDLAFSVQNDSAVTLFYSLTGPQGVNFFIEPGTTRSFTVTEGDYTLTYSQCPDGVERTVVKAPLRFHETIITDCD